MRNISYGMGSLLLAALLTLAASRAFADLQVIESNAAAYAVGSVLPDDTVFELESGERVLVLILPGRQTREFEGKGAHKLLEPRSGPRGPGRVKQAKDCIVSGECTPITLFFGTNRGRKDNERYKSFGSERSQELVLGTALVTVPKLHGRGQVERPSLWDLYAEDPTKHFVVARNGVAVFDSVEGFIARMKTERDMLTAFSDHAFVFVHGFNVTFEGALFRTAQIAYDLGQVIDGVHAQFGMPFMFSWPSKGVLSAYAADEDSARLSVARLRPFLEVVVRGSGAKNIHVIAHSMGNQIVLRTLEALAKERPDIKFSQIILAAPDVDRDEFEQIAKGIASVADGVTLYASSTDVALNVSKRLRVGFRRAGDVDGGGPLVVAGIDSIDISALGTDVFALNHDIYVGNAVLINDMVLLLGKGVRPPNRRTPILEQRITKAGRYWVYPR